MARGVVMHTCLLLCLDLGPGSAWGRQMLALCGTQADNSASLQLSAPARS